MQIVDEQFKELAEGTCQPAHSKSSNSSRPLSFLDFPSLWPNGGQVEFQWMLLMAISALNLLIAGLAFSCWLCCKVGGAVARRRKGKWSRE